jgi:hypothetical protein
MLISLDPENNGHVKIGDFEMFINNADDLLVGLREVCRDFWYTRRKRNMHPLLNSFIND